MYQVNTVISHGRFVFLADYDNTCSRKAIMQTKACVVMIGLTH